MENLAFMALPSRTLLNLEKVTCDPTLPKAKQVEQQKRKAAESGDTLLVPKRIKTTANGTDKTDGNKVINLKKKVTLANLDAKFLCNEILGRRKRKRRFEKTECKIVERFGERFKNRISPSKRK